MKHSLLLDISRYISAAVAIARAQVFMFPRPNLGFIRMYGSVTVRGSKSNLRLGSRVIFLGNATLVCGWDSQTDFIDVADGVVLEQGCYLNAHGGSIRLGADSFVGVGSVIQGKGGVLIGERTLLGPYIQIHSSDHPKVPQFQRKLHEELPGPVHIGDDVWVGAGTIILRNTSIGPGAIVAAGALVKGAYRGGTILGSKACVATELYAIHEQ